MGLYIALHSWPKLIGFWGSMDTLSKKVDILQNENLKHMHNDSYMLLRKQW
jgi:hypothetical protein